jgi:hypothetical protein
MTVKQIRDMEIPLDIEKADTLNSVSIYREDKIIGDVQEFEDLIMYTYQAGTNAIKEAIVQKILVSCN